MHSGTSGWGVITVDASGVTATERIKLLKKDSVVLWKVRNNTRATITVGVGGFKPVKPIDREPETTLAPNQTHEMSCLVASGAVSGVYSYEIRVDGSYVTDPELEIPP